MRYSKDFDEIFCTSETIIKNVKKLKNKYKKKKEDLSIMTCI